MEPDQGVRSLGLERAIFILGGLLGLLVQFVHLVGIAVICRNQRHTTE